MAVAISARWGERGLQGGFFRTGTAGASTPAAASPYFGRLRPAITSAGPRSTPVEVENAILSLAGRECLRVVAAQVSDSHPSSRPWFGRGGSALTRADVIPTARDLLAEYRFAPRGVVRHCHET